MRLRSVLNTGVTLFVTQPPAPVPTHCPGSQRAPIGALRLSAVLACMAVMSGFMSYTVRASEATGCALEALQIAYRLGLSPEACAVAGLGPAETTAALLRVNNAGVERDRLTAAEQTVSAQVLALVRLEAEARANPTDEGILQACQLAAEALELARARVVAAEQDLRSAALAALPPESVAVLAVWQASAAFGVPAEFRVVALTNAEWEAIQSAVAAERRSFRTATPLETHHAETLAVVRAAPEVVAARTRLSHLLPSLRAVFRPGQ